MKTGETEEIIQNLEAELHLTKDKLAHAENELHDTKERLDKMTKLLDEANVTYANNILEEQQQLKQKVKENQIFTKRLIEEKAKCVPLMQNYDMKVADIAIHKQSVEDLMTEVGGLHENLRCSSFDARNIPLSSTSGTSHDNVQNQSFKTKRRSSITLVTIDTEDSDTQSEESSSSEIEITSPVVGFQISSPHSKKKSKTSFGHRSLLLKQICTRGDSPLRTTNVVIKYRKCLPLNAVPRTDRAEISSLNGNAPNIRLGNNEEIMISFPITPPLKEQSVKLQYDCDRVQVEFQQLRRDCSEAISDSQTTESNDLPNPAKRSRFDLDSDVIVLESDESNIAAPAKKSRVDLDSDVIVLESDENNIAASAKRSTIDLDSDVIVLESEENNIAASVPKKNSAAIDPCDIPSCSPAPFIKLEGNISAFNPAGHQAEKVIHVNTDKDQEVFAPELRFNHLLNSFNLSQAVTCPRVVNALEQLVDTVIDKEELKMKCEQLKSSLKTCRDSKASMAVNVTLCFLCSRNVSPLQEYLTTNDQRHLFPLSELCVVNAYNDMDTCFFRINLEDVLYKEIVGRGKKWNVVVLSTLCRVWAYLKKLKTAIHCARSICYSILKRYTDTAPYLIASIVSVFPTILEPPHIESEKCMYQVLCYMIANKPKNLQYNLWAQVSHLMLQYLPANTRLTAEDIIHNIVDSFVASSRDEEIPSLNAKNYVTAIEMLSSRFDWPWVYHNVIDKFLVPLIKAFSLKARRQSWSAVALAYRIIGSLGSGHDENSVLRELVKNTLTSMLNIEWKMPAYVIEEARYALYILETGCKEVGITDTSFKNWVTQNGYVNTFPFIVM